mmetsp:Transcript_51416/g.57409  ORF Transcript_51416/g.57409 Transcript_51416/m.57409 type:complete len:251 (+) Transcript_51416:154-906(+)
MMMITTIPCVILSLTLSISVVSAFSSSSSSSSIASRRSRFELSSTPFDIDIDVDDTTVALLKKTVPDVVFVPTTTTTTTASSVTTPVIDVLQQRPQILLRVTESTRTSSPSSSSSLAVKETSSAAGLATTTTTTTTPASSLPFVEKIKNIARNTDKELKKRYVIVLSRLLIVCVSFLPLVRTHEMMHKEEYLIQLFLLAISMQPLKKSVTLAQCITNSETGVEECQLEFEELEDAFDIDQPKRTKRKSSS